MFGGNAFQNSGPHTDRDLAANVFLDTLGINSVLSIFVEILRDLVSSGNNTRRFFMYNGAMG